MRFTDVLAASLVAPFVAAHGGMEGAPKLVGLPKELRARNPFAAHEAPRHSKSHAGLETRQAGRCGPDGGNQVCAENECCSGAGYCGTTSEHCMAPDCLINFGPACDANQTPRGASTRNDPRPQLGDIAYGGAGIYGCENPGTVALTYDDGPYIYTDALLTLFKQYDAKATFFVTGNNIGKGAIDDNWSGVIQRMVAEGHQVASHTWSHQDLSAITDEQIYDQMVKNEMAIRNIIGKYPTYMRPPYSSCVGSCPNILKNLGYVISYFDLDTDDYNQLTTEKIQVAKDNFKDGIDSIADAGGDRLSIAHDIHQLSAVDLSIYMLEYLKTKGLRAVTMGECMGDPEANWYRDSTPAPPSSSTRTSTGPVPTPTGPTSTDGSCGGTAGFSCVGFVGLDGYLGECCSQYGWCGNTADHCQTGCQAGFGKCGAQASAKPSTPAVSTTATGPVPTPTGPTSTDGSCGGTAGFSCIGFVGLDGALGECCSQYGWCGNSADHCGTGCNPASGKCGSSGSVSSSAVVSQSSSAAHSSSAAASSSVHASSTVHGSSTVQASSSAHASSSVYGTSSVHDVSSTVSHVSSAASATPTTSGEKSRDGTCGGWKGYTCVGFATLEGVAGECCSEFGWCGSSPDHCGAGCNPIYGNCPGSSSSAAASSSAGHATSSAYSVSASHAASSTHSVGYSASSTHSVDYPASTPLSVSKDSYPTGKPSSTGDYPAGQPSSTGGYPAGKPSSTGDYPAGKPSSTGDYPAGKPSSTGDYPAGKPSSTGDYPAGKPSTTADYPASSPAVKPSTTPCTTSATPIYTVSSFSTIVKPSSTPCATSEKPKPTGPVLSTDGKCGGENGQTCAGYKNSWGISVECCCKQSGKCSIDPWACGAGCDKGYGKCWY